MYSLEELIQGLRNPRGAAMEFSWLYHRKLRGRSGVDVMDRDWDNLIILDACRYDMFEELNEIEGELTSVISKGSSTHEFVRRNFKQERYLDTVYISANPQVQKRDIDEKFFDRMRLWETEWDEELRTVHPSNVVEETLETAEKYPNKRYIIHFIQPHFPFIGEKGRTINHGTITGDGLMYHERDYASVWRKLETGRVSKEAVWDAYTENLELTLPYIESLVDDLDGKSVVTSDHGNALGRWGVFGHPKRRYISDLVKVPWLVVDGDRREITRGNRIRSAGADADADGPSVEEQLADLGYVTE